MAIAQTAHFSGYQTIVPNGLADGVEAVAVDGSGNVYIANCVTSQVLRETPGAGGYVESTVPTSGVERACGLTVDRQGNVYITDTGYNQLVKVTFSGG
jgi:streptogramin lyase